MRWLLSIFVSIQILCLCPTAHADDDRVGSFTENGFQVGHNLTATSDILEKKTCTFGLQVVACRVLPRTVLGSSTWMLAEYKMYTAAVRHLISEDENGNRWAAQVSYFQTFLGPYDAGGFYEMRSLWLQGIRTWRVRDDYRLHANVHVNYYFNDRRPFSLRRPSATQTPFQVNISTLHQLALFKGWIVLGELGVLDLFRAPIHTHSGVSIGYDGGWYSWHIGYSLTATLAGLFSPHGRVDYQQDILQYPSRGYDDPVDADKADFDYAIHPEFALQLTF